MAKTYKQRPSQLLNIQNEYDAFCFDEACSYIISELSQEKPKTPRWTDEDITEKNEDTLKWIALHNKTL